LFSRLPHAQAPAAHAQGRAQRDAAPAESASREPARAEQAVLPGIPAGTSDGPVASASARLPHPLTEEHLRRQQEVTEISQAYEALEARDFARARQLVREHRTTSVGRHHDDIDEGLSLLADCMERPGSDTRGRAQRFYDEATYSTTRRRVKRWCLDVVPSESAR
jgi:hypothetical protein